MSRVGGLILRRKVGFPRVSGDEPGDFDTIALIDVFSPRERG